MAFQCLGKFAKRCDEILCAVHAGITEFVATFHQVVDENLLAVVIARGTDDCPVDKRRLDASDFVQHINLFANRLQGLDSRIRVRSLSDALRNHAIERSSRRHFEGHDAGLDVCIRKLKRDLTCDE